MTRTVRFDDHGVFVFVDNVRYRPVSAGNYAPVTSRYDVGDRVRVVSHGPVRPNFVTVGESPFTEPWYDGRQRS